MKDVKSISGINHHYPLGMHIDMQVQLYDILQPVAPAKILLDAADLPAWKSDIDKEKESVREPSAYAETKYLKEKDKKRDEIVTSLFQEIRMAARSMVEDRQKAGHRLCLIVDAYKGLQSENIANKTGHVTGLLLDLGKPEATADLTTLGLATTVPMLKNINDEFVTLRTQRLKAEAEDTQTAGTDLRAKNDATATKIFRHIEAAYIAAASDEDRKLVGDLIDRINTVLSYTKTHYSQSLALKRLAAERRKQPKDPKKPKKPKKGTDPEIRLPDDGKPKTPETPKKPEGGGSGSGKHPEGGGGGTGGGGKHPEGGSGGTGGGGKPSEGGGRGTGGSGGGPEIHLPEE